MISNPGISLTDGQLTMLLNACAAGVPHECRLAFLVVFGKRLGAGFHDDTEVEKVLCQILGTKPRHNTGNVQVSETLEDSSARTEESGARTPESEELEETAHA